MRQYSFVIAFDLLIRKNLRLWGKIIMLVTYSRGELKQYICVFYWVREAKWDKLSSGHLMKW